MSEIIYNFISEYKQIKSKTEICFYFCNSRLAPNGVDVVLDCLCGEDANKGYGLLKPMGRYILYGMFHSLFLVTS